METEKLVRSVPPTFVANSSRVGPLHLPKHAIIPTAWLRVSCISRRSCMSRSRIVYGYLGNYESHLWQSGTPITT